MSACARSTMPRPARSTGTNNGGFASCTPVVVATGVCTLSSRNEAPRVASYTSMVVSSRSAVRKPALSVFASRIVVRRAAASGWSISCTYMSAG